MLSDSGEVPGDGDKHSAENNSKKRKLKTPIQVMALENFYNEHKYPSEEMKAKIADEIGLTEKQVSGWFCHRRLKDKRSVKEDGNNIGSQDRSSVVLQDRGSVLRQDSCGSTKQTDYWNPKPREVESQRLYGGSYDDDDDGEDSTSSEKNLVSSKDGIRDVESSRYVAHPSQVMRSYKKPSGYLKVKGETENVAVTAVKRQLGRQYREDGPPLGVVFDPLPPGAFEPQTNVVVQEPIYVGNQRRSHPPYFTGTRKSFVPGPSYELARKSKMHSSDAYSEDDDDDDDGDDNMMVGMEPGLGDKPRLKSPSLSYSNTAHDHISLKGPPQGITLTNSKKSQINSRSNLISDFHNLSGSNQTHDYGKSGGRKTGYLTKSSNMLPLSSSRSSDSVERVPSSGMVGKYHGEKMNNHMKMNRDSLHSTSVPPVNKRLKHGYPQQGYAPKSSNSETFERKDRSGVELPSSFNGDETEESSSSMD